MNVLTDEAIAGRGVAESFNSMGTRLAAVSIHPLLGQWMSARNRLAGRYPDSYLINFFTVSAFFLISMSFFTPGI